MSDGVLNDGATQSVKKFFAWSSKGSRTATNFRQFAICSLRRKAIPLRLVARWVASVF